MHAQKNRIYTPVRNEADFSAYLSLSTAARRPLITLWTASNSDVSREVAPIVEELIASGVGEDEGSVSYCEVEYDSFDIIASGLRTKYHMIMGVPTLLSFDRGWAQSRTEVTDPSKMKDREWLKEWIREAIRRGNGGSEDHW